MKTIRKRLDPDEVENTELLLSSSSGRSRPGHLGLRAHRLQKVARLMSEGRPPLHPSLSAEPPPGHSCGVLLLLLLSSLCLACGRDEDVSMLSACNRRRLRGRRWLSAAAPVANYPQSSTGGQRPLATLENKPPSAGRPSCFWHD